MNEKPTTKELCGIAALLKIEPDALATYKPTLLWQGNDGLLLLDEEPNFQATYEVVKVGDATKFAILLEDYEA